jgi:hypothetical protein
MFDSSFEHKGEGSYTLYVNTTGHELYVLVNGNLVGQCSAPVKLYFASLLSCHRSDHADVRLQTILYCVAGQKHSTYTEFDLQLESPAELHSGKNYISLLSGTVGLKVGNSSHLSFSDHVWMYDDSRLHVFLCERATELCSRSSRLAVTSQVCRV